MHEPPILAGGVEVIDQHPHAHAAVRREAHMMQQDARGIVLVNDVVLNVEGALGMIGEGDEIGQRLLARGQQADTGQVLAACLRRNDVAERGRLRMPQRLAVGLLTCRGKLAQPDSKSTTTARRSNGRRPRVDGWPHFIAHRRIISGTLCSHADATSHSQLRLARRPNDARRRSARSANFGRPMALILRDDPLDLEAMFGRRAPRCLEIGFGIGEVIGSLAETTSAHRLPRHRGASPGSGPVVAARARCRRLHNLRVICHDAVEVLQTSIRDGRPSTRSWCSSPIPGTRSVITSAG